jgi:hypothetical protein
MNGLRSPQQASSVWAVWSGTFGPAHTSHCCRFCYRRSLDNGSNHKRAPATALCPCDRVSRLSPPSAVANLRSVVSQRVRLVDGSSSCAADRPS